jgi:hypothetical protein
MKNNTIRLYFEDLQNAITMQSYLRNINAKTLYIGIEKNNNGFGLEITSKLTETQFRNLYNL